MVCWVATLLAVMLGGIEINIAKAKLNTTIMRSDLVFLLEMFRVALISIPIVLPLIKKYEIEWDFA
jgi:TRAP-type mannitol/chloroaromatic compound transport system permease large subunit